MKTRNAAFEHHNAQPNKEMRLVVKINYPTPAFFTSHSDIAGLTGNVFNSTLKKTSSTSAKLNPAEARSEIGSISFDLVDVAGAVTAHFKSETDAKRGLKGKFVELYLGYAGLNFSDFSLEQTQVIDDVMTFDGGTYSIKCRDIQREMRKDIFDLAETKLAGNLGFTDTTIPVYSTADFEFNAHGSSYSDLPNESVIYFKIKYQNGYEICSATGKTANTFTNVRRGLFGTKAVPHRLPENPSENNSIKVVEYPYLELPAVKLAYALLTGKLIGSAGTIPARWHLGIPEQYVNKSEFENIGADIFDPSNDQKGFIVRFGDGIKKTDGKRFIEKEIALLAGFFTLVRANGALGCKRMTGVLSGSDYVAEINPSNITKCSALKYDNNRVYNTFDLIWSYLEYSGAKPAFYRQDILADGDSQQEFGASKPKRLAFKGLHNSRHTYTHLRNKFDALRDRHAGPPLLLSADLLPSFNGLEVGDIVKVNLDHIKDIKTGQPLDRSMEVQQVKIDQLSQKVSVSLFGSYQKAAPVTDGASYILPDAWYNAEGAAVPIPLSNGAMTVDGTLNGGTDTRTIFYYLGDLTVPAGRVLTVTGNVELRVMGHFQVEGDLVCSPVFNGDGFIGTTWGGNGVYDPNYAASYADHRWKGIRRTGKHDTLPALEIVNDGGEIEGVPADMRGTGGAAGGWGLNSQGEDIGVGGQGGGGGSSIVVVARGMALGTNGKIILNGGDGLAGSNANAGSGGGGAPGVFVLLQDGSSGTTPFLINKVEAKFGSSPSPRAGKNGGDLSEAAYRIIFIPKSRTPYPDYEIDQNILSGAGTIYTQANAPENPNKGDVWYSTNDQNHPYWWSGAAWISLRDGHALQVANAAQAAADAATNVTLINPDGALDIVGGNIKRNENIAAGWASQAYSKEFFVGSAFVSFQIKAIKNLMVALNRDPETDASFTSLDYAWYIRTDGSASPYESGSNRGYVVPIGGVAVGDTFSIQHDGQSVKYYRNGALLYTSATAPSKTQPYYLDSSFSAIDGEIEGLKFGPSFSNVADWAAVSGAGKPQDNATATSGDNLLFNGDLELDSNQSFSSFLYQNADAVSWLGKHLSTVATSAFGDQFIDVDTLEQYEQSATLACDQAGARFYAGVTFYDKNKELLEWCNCYFKTDGYSTVYEAASAGSTSLKINPTGTWVIGAHTFLQAKAQPDGSHLPTHDIVRISSIDTSNANYWVLNLAAGLPVSLAVGDGVAKSDNGSTYAYNLGNNTPCPQQAPAKFSGVYSGVNGVNEAPPVNKFRIGTKYVKLSLLPNRTVGGITRISNLSLRRLGSRLASIEEGATVGAEWGDNISGQPSDSALLNSQQQWSDVNGSGKPADNADVTDYADTRVANGISQGGVLTVARPLGGNFSVNASDQIGALRILLPQLWTNTMLRFKVDIFNYSTGNSVTYEVSGYNYTSGWINVTARMIGSSAMNRSVRFGHDGNKACVWIGETNSSWQFPKVSIRDFSAGFSNYALSQWESGWAVSLQTSFNTVLTTISNVTPASDWNEGVNRPVELTDGRVPNTIHSAGQLAENLAIDQGNGVFRRGAFGLAGGSCRDGDAVNFTTAYDTPPRVKIRGGLTHASGLSGDQAQDLKAVNVSTSGFTVSAKVKELAGSVTSHTDTSGAANVDSMDFVKHKSQSLQAYDDKYTFQIDVDVDSSFESEVGQWIGGWVKVGFYTNDGTGWVKRAEKSYNGANTSSGSTYLNDTVTVTVDGLSNHGGYEFAVDVIATGGAGGSITAFDSVKYTTASSPSETSATPAGVSDLEWEILGGD